MALSSRRTARSVHPSPSKSTALSRTPDSSRASSPQSAEASRKTEESGSYALPGRHTGGSFGPPEQPAHAHIHTIRALRSRGRVPDDPQDTSFLGGS